MEDSSEKSEHNQNLISKRDYDIKKNIFKTVMGDIEQESGIYSKNEEKITNSVLKDSEESDEPSKILIIKNQKHLNYAQSIEDSMIQEIREDKIFGAHSPTIMNLDVEPLSKLDKYKQSLKNNLEKYLLILREKKIIKNKEPIYSNCLETFDEIISFFKDFKAFYAFLPRIKDSRYVAIALIYSNLMLMRVSFSIQKLLESVSISKNSFKFIISRLKQVLVRIDRFALIEKLNFKINKTIKKEVYLRALETFIRIYQHKLENELKHEFGADFKDAVISLFNQSLELSNTSKFGFKKFTESFTYSSYKVVAASIIYIVLLKKSFSLTQKRLAEILGIEYTNLTITTRDFFTILKDNREHFLFINNLANQHPEILDSDIYKTLLYENLRIYRNALRSGYSIRIDLDLVWKTVESKKELNDLLKNIQLSPKHLSLIILYAEIFFSFDIDMKQDAFIEYINSNISEIYKVNYQAFSKRLSHYFKHIFVLNKKRYDFRVKNYLKKYIDKAVKWINSNADDISETYPSLDIILLDNGLDFYNRAIRNGFRASYFDDKGEFIYYFPQIIALSLLYYSLNTLGGLEDFASNRKFEEIFGDIEGLEVNYSYITMSNRNPVYSFIKDVLPRFKGEIYSKEEFIHIMRETLAESYHLETDLLLRLYLEVSDSLDPREFNECLEVYKKLSHLINRTILGGYNFRYRKTFVNIRKFIDSEDDKGEFYIKEDSTRARLRQFTTLIQQLRYFEYIEQYNQSFFIWKEERLARDSVLHTFLDKIYKDEFTTEIKKIYKDSFQRASNLYLSGTLQEPLKIQYLINFFKNKHLKAAKNFKNILRITNQIFKSFEDSDNGPTHPKVLSKILNQDNRAIAIEVPVWKELKEGYLTGHIDIILLNKSEIIIADFKPDENEIFRAIPQLIAYAFLLMERLKEFGDIKKFKFRCVGFNNKVAWEFNPFSILKFVIKFLNYEASKTKRSIPIRSTRAKGKEIALEKELKTYF